MRKFIVLGLLCALPALGATVTVIDDNLDANADSWQLNGAAAYVAADGDIQLTPNTGGLAGSAFFKTPVALGGEFTVEFEFNMIPPAPPTCDADGMAFVIMSSAATPNFLGGTGGYMGISGANSTFKTLMVEIDNWNDGNAYDRGNENHIGVAFFPNGLGDFSPRSQFLVNPADVNTFGAPDFEWTDPATQAATGPWKVILAFNRGQFTLTLECLNELNPFGPEIVLQGNFQSYQPWEDFGEALVGFAGGTGGCVMDHRIKNVKFTMPDAPTALPYNFTCAGTPNNQGIAVNWIGTATGLTRNGTPIDIAGKTPPILDAVGAGVYYYELTAAGQDPLTCRVVYSPDPGDPFSIFTVREDFEGVLDPNVWRLFGTATMIDGRVQLTSATNGQLGFIALDQPFFTERFHFEFDFEIANGTLADGMAIVFLSTGQVEGIPGWGGGMLGQGGQGFGPILGLEIDNYWNGAPMDGPQATGTQPAGGNGCRDHVGVNYTANPNGFLSQDNMTATSPYFIAYAPISDNAGWPGTFNGSGVWRVFGDVDGGAITIALQPPGGAKKTVLNKAIPGWRPFFGYLGFCGSTGGANQEHWIDNLVLQVKNPVTPKNFTVAVADDDVTLTWTNLQNYTTMTLFRNGVQIATKPDFTNNAQRYVDSNLPGGRYEYMLQVEYIGEQGTASGVVDVLPMTARARLTADGFVTAWITLGPFKQDVTAILDRAAPGYDLMAADWLTDGVISETDIRPKAGERVETAYVDLSPALSLWATTRTDDNPGGLYPTWFLWQDTDGNIAYEDIHLNDVNDAMSYAVAYIHNPNAQPADVYCGYGTDDSAYLRLNGEEVSYHNEPRGSGGAIQDWACLHLVPGMNCLLFKTFEGGGGFNFNFRLQDVDGTPIAFEQPFSYHVNPGEPGGSIQATTTDGKNYQFTAVTSAPVVSYEWDFDATDGNYIQARAQTVDYAFPANGTFLVTCAVRTAGGITAVYNALVTVTGALAPQIIDVLPDPDVCFQNAPYRRVMRVTSGTPTWSVTTAPAGIGAAIDADGVLTLPATAATGAVTFTVTATSAIGTDSDQFTVNFNLTEFADDFAANPLLNPTWVPDFPWDGGNITLSGDSGMVTVDVTDLTSNYDVWCGFDRAPKLRRPVTGDFSAEAKVTIEAESDPTGGALERYRHAGLMVQFDDSYTTPDSFMWGFIRTGVNMERNCGYDGMNVGDTPVVVDNALVAPYDGWFRLDRVGPVYTFYYKLNVADQWTLYRTITFDREPLWVGLFYKNFGEIATVSFDDVTIKPLSGGYDPGVSCAVGADGKVTLTWNEAPGATGATIFGYSVYTDEWTEQDPAAVWEELGTVAGGVKTFQHTPVVANGYNNFGYRLDVAYDDLATTSSCMVGVPAAGWVAFQDGFAPTPAYTGVQDAHTILYRTGISEYNTGRTDTIESGGWDLTGVDYKHGFIKFDVGAIPAGTTIQGAALSLHFWYERSGIAGASVLHTQYIAPVLKAWNEGHGLGVDGEPALCGELTYQSATRYDEPWEVPGTFGVSDVGAAVAQAEVDPADITAAWQCRILWESEDFTALVQNWINNPNGNNGVKLAPPTDGDMHNATGTYATGGYDFTSSDYNGGFYNYMRPALLVQVGGGSNLINVKMGTVNAGPGVDIADAIALLGYLFAQKAPPLCAKAADANDDDALNIADAITILGYLFSGKPMFAPDHSEIKAANNTCKGYDKSNFPAKIGALNACETPCVP